MKRELQGRRTRTRRRIKRRDYRAWPDDARARSDTGQVRTAAGNVGSSCKACEAGRQEGRRAGRRGKEGKEEATKLSWREALLARHGVACPP